jgi:hypothetical protein
VDIAASFVDVLTAIPEQVAKDYAGKDFAGRDKGASAMADLIVEAIRERWEPVASPQPTVFPSTRRGNEGDRS